MNDHHPLLNFVRMRWIPILEVVNDFDANHQPTMHCVTLACVDRVHVERLKMEMNMQMQMKNQNFSEQFHSRK